MAVKFEEGVEVYPAATTEVGLTVTGKASATASLLNLVSGATPAIPSGVLKATLVSLTDPGIVIVPPASYTGRTLAFGLDDATPSGAIVRVGTPVAAASTTAGNPLSLIASAAIAGTSVNGAAAGGGVTITSGDAARKSSGDAAGGTIRLKPGVGVGAGAYGVVQIMGADDTSDYTQPKLVFNNLKDTGIGSYSFTNLIFYMNATAAGQFRIADQTFSLIGAGETGYKLALGASSATTAGTVFLWSRAAGGPSWGLPSATPVAYTHTLSASSRGGTDSNVAGAAATILPGLGTGLAASGDFKVQTGYAGSTGTTQNTPTDRIHVESAWTTLTESSATAFATLTFGASNVASAEFFVTVQANDATDFQCLTSRVRVSSVRKAAGNTVSAVNVVGTDLLAESAGGSTLTCTFTVTEGASAVVVNANAVSSLAQTTLRLSYLAVVNGPATVS